MTAITGKVVGGFARSRGTRRSQTHSLNASMKAGQLKSLEAYISLLQYSMCLGNAHDSARPYYSASTKRPDRAPRRLEPVLRLRLQSYSAEVDRALPPS